jgi:hypothetical protein
MPSRTRSPTKRLIALVACALLMLLSAAPAPVALAQCGGPLAAGQSRSARIERPGATCSYTYAGKPGELISVQMNTTERSLDPWLDLYDPRRQLITSNDDTARSQNSRIPTLRLGAQGDYSVVARAADNKGTGAFTLLVERSAPLAVGAQVSGALSPAQPKLRYSFDGKAGASVTIWMQVQSGSIDPWLDLEDPAGEVVISDDDSLGGANSQIANYRLRGDGIYTIVARTYDGTGAGNFTLGLNAGR